MTRQPSNEPTFSFSFAFADVTAVRLASGMPCPWCGRTLRAADCEVDNTGDDFAMRLICGTCHQDILLIESTET